jgi:phosphopentomutase
VMAVGKISDIFTGNGITWSESTESNQQGVRTIHAAMAQGLPGLIFANLVDFDMLYGHRRDVRGYAQALMDFDQALPEIIDHLTPEDALILTADHGNDPTHHGTDHTREYVPVLVYGNQIKPGAEFGRRSTLADLGATIAELLNTPYQGAGTSFAGQIHKLPL